MTREEALRFCLHNEGIDLSLELKPHGICPEQFILALIKGESFTRSLGVSQRKASVAVSCLFPHKPRTTVKLCTWLLENHNLKCCSRCKLCLSFNSFYKEVGRRSGLANNCKACSRARETRSMPKWADIQAIALIYANTPIGCHVDHIIPLNGKNVCGLHVEYNLTYLPEKLNLAKGNKMPCDFFMSLRPDKPPTLVEISS